MYDNLYLHALCTIHDISIDNGFEQRRKCISVFTKKSRGSFSQQEEGGLAS